MAPLVSSNSSCTCAQNHVLSIVEVFERGNHRDSCIYDTISATIAMVYFIRSL